MPPHTLSYERHQYNEWAEGRGIYAVEAIGALRQPAYEEISNCLAARPVSPRKPGGFKEEGLAPADTRCTCHLRTEPFLHLGRCFRS